MSQSLSLSRSPVVVPKLWVNDSSSPLSSITRTHATTEALWTSSPAQRRMSVSKSYLPQKGRKRRPEEPHHEESEVRSPLQQQLNVPEAPASYSERVRGTKT